jgi:RNA polymerase sigma-70 factor (ECF subfamily)
VALTLDEVEIDSWLVAKVQSGDHRAFSDLYRRHRDRLYRFCLYRLHDPHEAEDVVQEAFARAFTHVGRLRQDSRFYPWLRTIAGNLCTDVGRRRVRSEPTAEVDTGSVEGVEDQLVAEVDVALLRAAMGRLPERQRSILEQREFLELSYEELAAENGVSLGTVESLLFRARQGLKKQFVAAGGALGSLPWTGRLVRRLRLWTVRQAGWSGRVAGAVESAGGAFSAAALGSALATVMAVTHAGGVPPVVLTTQVRQFTASTSLALPVPARTLPAAGSGAAVALATASASGAYPAGSAAGSGQGATRFVNPVHVGAPTARQEVSRDPIRAQTPVVSIGVDPATLSDYAAGVAAQTVNLKSLGG